MSQATTDKGNTSEVIILQFNATVLPKIEENKSKGYVTYGVNNSFYDYIIARFKGSPTNSAINRSYMNSIYGSGIKARDAAQKANQWANFISLIKPSDLKKIVADFQLFNEAAIQVVKTKDKKKAAGIYHLPKQKVVPGVENEDGEIDAYWYSKNWKKLSQNPPEKFAAFGTSNDAIEVYVIKPYVPGCEYFSDPDYLSALQHAEIEEEIGRYGANSAKQGLSAGYVINWPDNASFTPEEKEKIKKQIQSKATGSENAQKFLLNFYTGEAMIKIEAIPVNEKVHQQWNYWAEEAKKSIMIGHQVVSPMLFGIKDSTGLGNNANELEVAEAQMMQRVVAPKQQHIIDALKEIVSINGITLDLYFEPNKIKTANTGNTQFSLSEADPEKKNLDTTVADELIKLGEDDPGPEWELVEVKVVEDYEADMKFTSTGTAIPNAKSVLDGKKFMSRFRYAGKVNPNSREFCRKMLAANKLYRLEDINKMSATVVNEGWGPRGADTYDIFLYKGGGNCKHAWQRESYRLKTDVNSPLAKEVTPAEARKAGEILPTVDKKAYTKPEDMPYKGFLEPK